MSKTVGYKLNILETDSTTGNINYIDYVNTTYLPASVTPVSSGKTITKSSSGTALDFGAITTAEVLYIQTDIEVTVNIDGNPLVVGDNGFAFLVGISATAITVDNASSTTDANVSYYMAGA